LPTLCISVIFVNLSQKKNIFLYSTDSRLYTRRCMAVRYGAYSSASLKS